MFFSLSVIVLFFVCQVFPGPVNKKRETKVSDSINFVESFLNSDGSFKQLESIFEPGVNVDKNKNDAESIVDFRQSGNPFYIDDGIFIDLNGVIEEKKIQSNADSIIESLRFYGEVVVWTLILLIIIFIVCCFWKTKKK